MGLWLSPRGMHLYALCGWIDTMSPSELILLSEHLPLWLESNSDERCALLINTFGEAFALSDMRDIRRECDKGKFTATALELVVREYSDMRLLLLSSL